MFNLFKYLESINLEHLEIKMPIDEYRKRVEATIKELRDKDYDAGIVYGSEFRPGDVGWLTGFEPVVEPVVLIIGQNGQYLLGGPSFKKYATQINPDINFRYCREFSIKEDYENIVFSSLLETLTLAAGKKPKKVAIMSPFDIITYNIIKDLNDNAIKFESFDDYLLKKKHIKSDNELKMVKIATRITEIAMEAAIKSVKPGIRELEVSAVAEYVIRYLGSSRQGIMTVVMSGKNVSNVGTPGSNKIIEKGDLITISTSAKWEGLNGITGRTFVVGKEPDENQNEFLAIAEKSYLLALENFKYGDFAYKVDEIPRSFLRENGLVPFYSTAHNTGWTECMEGYGGFSSASDFKIPKNIAHMIDIGIFNQNFKKIKAEDLGCRIEGTLIVDSNGKIEHLNKLPLRVESLLNY